MHRAAIARVRLSTHHQWGWLAAMATPYTGGPGGKPPLKGVPTTNEAAEYLSQYSVDVLRVITRYPPLKRYSRERLEAVVAHLEVLHVDVRRVVSNHPSLLAMDPRTLETKVQWMQSRGLDVARVVNVYPGVLKHRITALEAKMAVIATFGNAAEIVNCRPGMLRVGLNRLADHAATGQNISTTSEQLNNNINGPSELLTPQPKSAVDYLESLGLDPRVRSKCPQLLYVPIGKVEEIVSYLEAQGANVRRILRVNPNILACRLERLKEKVAFLEENGLDVARHLWTTPSLLGFSVDQKLRPILRFVLDHMGRSRVEVDRYPLLWLCSLERRLRPRFLYLQSLGREAAPLHAILFPGDETFCRVTALEELTHYRAWQCKGDVPAP
eukprot:EG_transcript_16247